MTVPTARYDVVADPSALVRAVAGLPRARTRVVPTGHFLPLEAPDVVAAELSALVDR